MNQKDLRGFTARHMKYVREVRPIPYIEYVFNNELAPGEKEAYQKYISPFIRKRNLIARLTKRDPESPGVARLIRKQINEGRLPQQYRLFLREYYPQSKS